MLSPLEGAADEAPADAFWFWMDEDIYRLVRARKRSQEPDEFHTFFYVSAENVVGLL